LERKKSKGKTASDKLENLCREAGISMTSKRRVICRVLEKAKGHPDAQAVHAMAKKVDPSIGIATVYRTLKLMKAGKVADFHSFGQEHSHFESPIKEHHDHLVCTDCGGIFEFHSKELETAKKQVAKKHRFIMQSHKLDIYGLCKNCASKRKQSSA